ncbi:MAG TPA: hypothetical protein ENN47_06785 [Mesotoga infera]|uniref:Uncharacterized protein n=1 Tax=Mesotoga infera TaxID=1236046 RepID=A0A7C1CYU3_9BACT|nr:hypothetical protein [Mesotoga infera]
MKRVLIHALVLLFVLSFASSAIGSSFDLAKDIADSANEQIESLIETAVQKAEKFTEHYEEKGMALLAYETLIDNLGNDLSEKAFLISQSAITRIEELGYKAICYYIPVKLGYKVFLIDPILIIDD